MGWIWNILIKNYITEYNKTHLGNPALEDISKALNLELNDIVLALEANTMPLSLNEQFNSNDDGTAIIDTISDNFSVDGFMDKLSLREMIEGLTSREKQVIIMRYYLDKTQSEIAKELGVSQVQISRIENKVLSDMKEKMLY